MNEVINDRGRGPEIAGTRITVYDIWDYAKDGWHTDAIAATLRLSSAQIKAAIDYINLHKAEVLETYQNMLDRDSRGNPPDLQAKLDRTHVKYQALWKERELAPQSDDDQRNSGR